MAEEGRSRAFLATYVSDRAMVDGGRRITIEVSHADFLDMMHRLVPGAQFGFALIDPEVARDRDRQAVVAESSAGAASSMPSDPGRVPKPPSSRAHLLCGHRGFQDWLGVRDDTAARLALYDRLEVDSLSQIKEGTAAEAAFLDLEEAWWTHHRTAGLERR